MALAGRGWGKTKTAAEWLAYKAISTPNTRWAVIAPTFGDVRDTCAEGPSGLVNIFREYGVLENYNRSMGEILLTNKSRVKLYSGEEPDRLRGPNFHGGWIDEMASFSKPDAWDQYKFALRLGDHPQTVITTTPRPTKLIKSLLSQDGTLIVRGSTFDNEANLAPSALADLRLRYENTRLGRQELYGEIIDDVEGALWSRQMLEDSRVTEHPPLIRIVVAIDPAVTSGENSDETGIVVAGITSDSHYYVLEDLSCRQSPEAWARIAVDAYHRHKADRIVAETNNGGDMIESLIRQVDATVSYKKVTATRGKLVRAEPVAALWEQGRAHLVNGFAVLEDELTNYTVASNDSPNHLDACIAEGTPIITRRGNVPIEQVVIGDEVWTRKGWRMVQAARMTRSNAETMTVELSNGQTLTATPDHRIWVEGKGWTTLDAMVWGDRLSVWKNTQSLLGSTTSTIAATLTRLRNRAATITRFEAVDCFIEPFGKAFTAQSRPVTRFTILTTTRSIMTLLICYASRLSNTLRYTHRSLGKLAKRTLNALGRWLLSGTDRMKGWYFTANLANLVGNYANRANAIATNVETNTITTSMTHVTALELAAIELMTEPSVTRTKSPAQSAANHLSKVFISSNPKPVGASVVRLYESKKTNVYDLMVEGEHEFAASGVIVHNCVWGITELMDGAAGILGLASLAIFCDSCKMPNSKSATVCRSCGVALGVANV